MKEPYIAAIEDEAKIVGLFPLMVQLRPHLQSASEFVERWQRQASDGYRLAVLYDHGQAQALAGYRVQENFMHGRFLYVDDLVTHAHARGCGYGERLMGHLRQEARQLGCAKLVLDTPLDNALGQRFYFRCGLLARSLRFNAPIETSIP